MTLRPELVAMQPTSEMLVRLEELCGKFLLLPPGGAGSQDALAELERLTGKSLDQDFVQDIPEEMSVRYVAERLAFGQARLVPDISHDELADVVRLICDAPSEACRDYYLDLFCINVTHHAASDLIYYPEKYWPKGYEPTAEEIVEKAMDAGNVIRL